jgi:hypothetical protein
MTKQLICQAVATLAVVLLLGLSGFADADEADFEIEIYCSNVKSGIWPDYTNSYKDECESRLPSC